MKSLEIVAKHLQTTASQIRVIIIIAILVALYLPTMLLNFEIGQVQRARTAECEIYTEDCNLTNPGRSRRRDWTAPVSKEITNGAHGELIQKVIGWSYSVTKIAYVNSSHPRTIVVDSGAAWSDKNQPSGFTTLSENGGRVTSVVAQYVSLAW